MIALLTFPTLEKRQKTIADNRNHAQNIMVLGAILTGTCDGNIVMSRCAKSNEASRYA